MGMNDVPQSPTPVTTSSKRLTLQHFVTASSLVRRLAPNNQDARPPADWSTWPPPVVLDVLYGIAAIKRWATPTTADLIHKSTKADYYEQENTQAKAVHTAKQVAERLQRTEKRGSGGEIDAFDMILYLSRLSGPRYLEELTLPPSQSSPEDFSREKVEQWLRNNSSM